MPPRQPQSGEHLLANEACVSYTQNHRNFRSLKCSEVVPNLIKPASPDLAASEHTGFEHDRLECGFYYFSFLSAIPSGTKLIKYMLWVPNKPALLQPPGIEPPRIAPECIEVLLADASASAPWRAAFGIPEPSQQLCEAINFMG
jgi:hypothetical protein